jgi:hypothetical protein
VGSCTCSFSDVFVPDLWMPGYELAEELFALRVVEIDHLNAVIAEPVDPALECFGFADDDRADAELADEAAAVPAWGERRRHYRVSIAALAARFAKSIRLPVDRRIILLHAAIVAAAKQIAFAVEQRRSDRDTALGRSKTSFFDGDLKQLLWIDVVSYCHGNISPHSNIGT